MQKRDYSCDKPKLKLASNCNAMHLHRTLNSLRAATKQSELRIQVCFVGGQILSGYYALIVKYSVFVYKFSLLVLILLLVL